MQIKKYLSPFPHPSIVEKTSLEQVAVYAAATERLEQETCFDSSTQPKGGPLESACQEYCIERSSLLLGPDCGKMTERLT